MRLSAAIRNIWTHGHIKNHIRKAKFMKFSLSAPDSPTCCIDREVPNTGVEWHPLIHPQSTLDTCPGIDNELPKLSVGLQLSTIPMLDRAQWDCL